MKKVNSFKSFILGIIIAIIANVIGNQIVRFFSGVSILDVLKYEMNINLGLFILTHLACTLLAYFIYNVINRKNRNYA